MTGTPRLKRTTAILRMRYERRGRPIRKRIRKMKRILSVCLILLMFSGCSLFRRVQYVPVETKVDSVYVEKIVERVDTLRIPLPPETVYVEVADTVSHLETSVAESWARVDTLGRLLHSLSNKKVSLEKEVVYRDRVVEKKVEVSKDVPVPVEVQVKYIPKYYLWIHRLFWVFVIFSIGLIYIRLKT